MPSDLVAENKRLALVGHKRCSKCGVVKPNAEFHTHKASGGGLHPRCRECRREGYVGAHMRRLQACATPEAALRYERKVEAADLAKRGLKRCGICFQVKDRKDFTVLSTRRNRKGDTRVQLSGECSACRMPSARAARQAENKAMAERGEKRCKTCGEVFPLEGFYRASHGGYQASCKSCYNRASNGRRPDADD